MLELELNASKDEAKNEPIALSIPSELLIIESNYRPNFKGVPEYYWEQTKCEKLMIVLIAFFIVLLAVVYTYVLVLWIWYQNSTQFSLIWFVIGCATMLGIIVVNSFSKPTNIYRK